MTTPSYGEGNASFQAAGEEAGLSRLVDDFYDVMETLPAAARIAKMHPDLTTAREKLKVFLAGWLGGPKLYAEKYYPIMIPRDHKHLDIGEVERDAWMKCMTEAVAKQPWDAAFQAYFLREIFVPAERVRRAAASRIEKETS